MSMNTIAETTERADNSSALARAAAALKWLGAAYVNWRLEQAALASLSAMSERELADIGLTRSDVAHAVRISAAPDRGER